MQDALGEIRIYLMAMWRRRWLGLAATWTVGLLGAITVFTLPDVYESDARIYIDTKSVLGPLVQDISVRSDVNEEVRIMQQTLLSRPNLRQVARATDMDLDVNTPAEMDRLITKIEQNTGMRAEGRELFRVSYADSDPVLAKNVVQALITIFIDKNTGQSRDEMQDARSFLEQEKDAYEAKLNDAEARITKFRAQNAIILGSTNYAQSLQSTQNRISEIQVEYDDLQNLVEQLQEQLDETPQFVAMSSTPQIVIGQNGATTTLGRIRTLQAQIDDLLLQYTESHPDVIALRRQLNRLVARYNSGDDLGGDLFNKTELPNPVYEQVQLKLLNTQTQAKQAKRRLEKAQARLNQLNEYASIAPALDQELAKLNRELNMARSGYQKMVDSLETLRMTQAIETKTDAVNFRIVEPPEVPTKPSAPNRILFLLAAFVFALGAGVGVAFLRSQIEEAFFEPKRLESIMGLPVLGTVTRVMSPIQRERDKRNLVAFGAATASFFVVFGALFIALTLIQPGGDGAMATAALM